MYRVINKDIILLSLTRWVEWCAHWSHMIDADEDMSELNVSDFDMQEFDETAMKKRCTDIVQEWQHDSAVWTINMLELDMFHNVIKQKITYNHLKNTAQNIIHYTLYIIHYTLYTIYLHTNSNWKFQTVHTYSKWKSAELCRISCKVKQLLNLWMMIQITTMI